MTGIQRVILAVIVATVLNILTVDISAAERVYTTDEDQPVFAKLVFAADALKTMTEIPFRIEFGDDPGHRPILHSAVCSLTMPAMPMPANHPNLKCSKSTCTGTAVFTMAGAWQATFGLIMENGANTSISIGIDMVEMK
ncbi:MAG: hypothetical protein C0623_07095 [Desulfuromonas sp.]|nr:MAG: hypothetical protein C0623_07095 [Desulfuromonas sp.]